MVNLILEWPTTMKLLNFTIMLKLFKKRFSIWVLQQGACMILQFMNRSLEAQVTSFGRINVRFKITQDKNIIISKRGFEIKWEWFCNFLNVQLRNRICKIYQSINKNIKIIIIIIACIRRFVNCLKRVVGG